LTGTTTSPAACHAATTAPGAGGANKKSGTNGTVTVTFGA
jgi:hypothetical protein